MYASLTNDVCMGGCWPSVWLGARRWAEGRAGHGMGRIVLAVHTMPLAIHTIPYQIHTMPLPWHDDAGGLIAILPLLCQSIGGCSNSMLVGRPTQLIYISDIYLLINTEIQI